ncbi:MAG: thiol reductant ABC exporter subunit CydD [Thermoleophilia bacterium]
MGPAGRRLLREVPAARRHLAVSTAAGLLAAACIVAQALLTAHVVAASVTGGAVLGDLTGPLAALAAVTLARALLAGVSEFSGGLAASRAAGDLRRRVTGALLRSRPVALHGARQGDVVAAATSGVDALEPFFSRYLPQVVLAVAVPAAILLTVVPVDATSAVVMAVTVPLIPVFMILIGKTAEARTRARWRSLARLSAHFLDVVRGLETLRAHNRAAAQEASVRAVGERHRAETMGTLRIAFLSALVLELLAMLGTALVAVTIGVRLAQGGMGLEAGLAVLLLAPELYLPLRQLGLQFHAAADGTAAAEALFAVADLDPAVPEPVHPVPAPSPADGPIALRGVAVTYPGSNAPALRDLDLQIAPGEFVALTGPSGAGKSTLGLLLVRLVAPTEGTLTVAGVDLACTDPADWRRHVAWVPQRPRLLPATLADNVRLGRPDASDDAVAGALRAAAAEHLVPLMHAMVGEGGRGLSAGERRRVGIARAVLRDAPLVVLDEPTAELDPETAARVADAVVALAASRTIVLITHARGLAARADRVVEIVEGRAADGAGRTAGRTR